MLDSAQINTIFSQAGVLQTGHFILASGRHSDKYMQCARLFQYAPYSEALCRALAEKFASEKIDAVIGPALGAIQMAYEVSRHLDCRNLFAERVEGKMTLRRTFEINPGERVLVVEDTVTTGGSVKEVMALVNEAGGTVAGIGCIVDRSGGNVDFGVPLMSVLSVPITSWEPENCPLCKQGIPAAKPGTKQLK